jgi:hypothetical protein
MDRMKQQRQSTINFWFLFLPEPISVLDLVYVVAPGKIPVAGRAGPRLHPTGPREVTPSADDVSLFFY